MSNTNLSKNAQLYLYPIRDQKLLLMSKEKNNSFANVKISIKVCESKNLTFLPVVKQKSQDIPEPTVTSTPTKHTTKIEGLKGTPKKENKEEKKDTKLTKKTVLLTKKTESLTTL